MAARLVVLAQEGEPVVLLPLQTQQVQQFRMIEVLIGACTIAHCSPATASTATATGLYD
jgi:CelD/BcsL family acetyltransferase involved in cellulose biosynthesis